MTRLVSVFMKMKSVPLNAMQTHRNGRGIDLSLLRPSARRGGWSAPQPGRFNVVERDALPIVQETVYLWGTNAKGTTYVMNQRIASTNKE